MSNGCHVLDLCLSQHSRDQEYPPIERHASSYNPLRTFDLAKGAQKHYQQQYGDMYFLRLAKLKPTVEEIAEESWREFEVGYAETLNSLETISLRSSDSWRDCTPCG